MSPVIDFEGPELAFNALGGGDGGGGGGFNLFADAGGGGDGESLTVDMVQELIETAIEPDSWNLPELPSMSKQGTLFINQTPEIHDLVAQLLANLRSQASLQVNTRIRVLDLRKAFIEEIVLSIGT